mmetsp:Transcript_19364/g.47524  ORF Transcript_19364/g.47524 Transcript_19364/m.47524 type:complete len:299 (+) Transcript_19364:31-927(+)
MAYRSTDMQPQGSDGATPLQPHAQHRTAPHSRAPGSLPGRRTPHIFTRKKAKAEEPKLSNRKENGYVQGVLACAPLARGRASMHAGSVEERPVNREAPHDRGCVGERHRQLLRRRRLDALLRLLQHVPLERVLLGGLLHVRVHLPVPARLDLVQLIELDPREGVLIQVELGREHNELEPLRDLPHVPVRVPHGRLERAQRDALVAVGVKRLREPDAVLPPVAAARAIRRRRHGVLEAVDGVLVAASFHGVDARAEEAVGLDEARLVLLDHLARLVEVVARLVEELVEKLPLDLVLVEL